jgi:hypothetical protein
MYTCELFSFHYTKTYLSLIITDPVMGFPLERIAVNHLQNTLPNCTKLGSFNVCHLKRFFTLSLDAINDHIWSFCFFISKTVDY